jgi:hypothetical protein
MANRKDLQEVVSNPEAVTSVLGEWPSLHDAEILSTELISMAKSGSSSKSS